jgi:hypothetical protein
MLLLVLRGFNLQLIEYVVTTFTEERAFTHNDSHKHHNRPNEPADCRSSQPTCTNNLKQVIIAAGETLSAYATVIFSGCSSHNHYLLPPTLRFSLMECTRARRRTANVNGHAQVCDVLAQHPVTVTRTHDPSYLHYSTSSPIATEPARHQHCCHHPSVDHWPQ